MKHPFAIPIVLILLVVAFLYGAVGFDPGPYKWLCILGALVCFLGTVWYLTPKKKKKKKKKKR